MRAGQLGPSAANSWDKSAACDVQPSQDLRFLQPQLMPDQNCTRGPMPAAQRAHGLRPGEGPSITV